MSISQTLSLNWSESGQSLTQNVTLTGSEELNISASIAGNTTNEQHALAFTQSLLQSIYISSDQALTLKTNSSSVPQDTLTIAANKPFCWYSGCGIANPFANNVTSLFVTNAGSTAANLNIKCLTNG